MSSGPPTTGSADGAGHQEQGDRGDRVQGDPRRTERARKEHPIQDLLVKPVVIRPRVWHAGPPASECERRHARERWEVGQHGAGRRGQRGPARDSHAVAGHDPGQKQMRVGTQLMELPVLRQ